MPDKNNNNNSFDPDKTRLSSDPQTSEEKTQFSHGYLKALTEIDSQFQRSDTQTGFIEAKKHADQALLENKIILNNRFVLIKTLGAGGMGTVYKAQDLRKVEAQDSNPFVAVKILNSDFKNHPDAFIALQRETSRSHTLAHPNIVTVHDFDRDGDTIYMTMELLEGEDLESLLSRHRDQGLDKKQALEIIKDIGIALDFAHQKGIIHSDLKPGNIFVTKHQGTKILDFGIARLAFQAQSKDHFDAGRIGAITPAYASLEMLAHQSPDPRDDVYAAAIIAYELLTGKHPYQKMPAAVALANHLKPQKIKKLTNYQWRYLAKALEFKRQDRLSKSKDLVKALTGKKQWKLLQTAGLLLIGAVAWVGYDQYFAANQLRQVMQETLTKAERCFQNQQFQCSIESANALLEMSSGYQPALDIKNKALVAQLADQIDQCIQQDEFEMLCAQQPLQSLRGLIAGSSQLMAIEDELDQKQRELMLNNHRNLANTCFEHGDYACAIRESNAILTMQPQDEQAIDLINASNQALESNRVSAVKQHKAYLVAMSSANKCYQAARYTCAISNLKKR
ncbi:MAG: serine/threonine-protein kinase [Enterobacterales bacterium]|nr:serine/threonine-protein kinase [Enterobacterales bacterium]